MPTEEGVRELIEGAGGKVDFSSGRLPDGSGFMTASFPLPQDHWIYQETGEPPAPWWQIRGSEQERAFRDAVYAAAKYAIKGATSNGREMDFDPDALLQNLMVGLLGYNDGATVG